jgi:hypothetical protein
MTESESADNVAAMLSLECPNHHHCGQLIAHRGQTAAAVDYLNLSGVRVSWILHVHDGMFSLPTCPGGCQFQLAEIPEKLLAKLDELANNPDEDQDSYTLPFLGPPTELGQIVEIDS